MGGGITESLVKCLPVCTYLKRRWVPQENLTSINQSYLKKKKKVEHPESNFPYFTWNNNSIGHECN